MDTGLVPDKLGLSCLGLAALAVSFAMGAQAQTYTVIDIGTLGGSCYGDACVIGINNSGQVVGWYYAASGDIHPFLYSSGELSDLCTLGCSGGVAAGINNFGQVVGYAGTADGSAHAFLYRDGTMIDLNTPPWAPGGEAAGINDGGQVAGTYYTAGGSDHAFLYDGRAMIDLGTLPGGSSSYASGINNSGQVVGYANIAGGGVHAFLYSGGTMKDLGTLPGASSSYATGINNSGQVVGYAISADLQSYHPFLYGGGIMTDLGSLGGSAYAWGINNSGQVVGSSYNSGDADPHAFLWSGGTMTDLNNFVSLPPGVVLFQANGINDRGQIAADGTDGHGYLLTPESLSAPGTSVLTVMNPFSPYANSGQAPQTLDVPGVLNSPLATSLAADGESAVVLAYRSKSPQPVTFTLSASGPGLVSGLPVGSLGQFEVSYLATPPSSPGGDFPNYTVTAPTSGPDAAGNYVFLALLWAPAAMPKLPLVTLAVTTTQQGQSATSQASIALEPPPLLLIHGIWSSAAGAGFSSGSQGFYDWMISGRYPHNLIYPVDYSVTVGATNLNSQAFSNADIQCILLSNVTDALAGAAAVGMAARTVDVVAHSMGGLVTRYFMSKGPPGCSLSGAALLPSPVHRLITIGTPHQGSQLATTLWNNQHLLSWFALGEILADPELAWFCLPVAASCTQRGLCMPSSACTLGGAMSDLGRPVDTGVLSLEPDSPEIQALLPSNEFTAIVGEAPSPLSPTEFLLDLLISAFLPGQSVLSILGYQPNDTIVPVSSQSPQSSGQTGSATVPGIVHGGICCGDVDETHSTVVWAQAYNWLTGGSGTVPGASPSNVGLRPFTTTSSVSQPILNLSGYTQVPASNVTFLPVTGSTLTINSATNITASSTKTISEVLLFQNVADPTDTALLYAMQSPFTIPFTPTRLGTANFGAIAVFNDNTYAMATLNYTLQPGDTPYALNLLNAPLASMSVGDSRVVQASALSPSGQINVTQVATYTARSGSASVFSVSAGGTITANGNGVDFLDVSYGGVTATAQIPVGPCTYALNPANQIVPSTGGTATIQVTTQSGCAWTATGGASWLPFSQAGGSGSGSITLTAAANSSGGTQGAIVSLAGLQAIVTQPSTACSYNLSQTQINAPAAGASGTITATTSCPVIASSNQTWVTAMPLGSSVQYTVAPNNGTSQRSATLTIGSVGVPVTQAALNLCDLQRNGSIGVADVQLIIDQALGLTPTVNDLNVDGVVNVVDLQIESNAALGPGCAAQ